MIKYMFPNHPGPGYMELFDYINPAHLNSRIHAISSHLPWTTKMASKFMLLFILATRSLSQKVNIFNKIPSDVDQCVKPCLFRPNNARTDVGDVLNCAAPYLEHCYCAINDKQADLVSEHIDDCAQASCSAGIETKDASSMRLYYASYCMENGYTADAMTEWYTGTVVQEATRASREDMWGWNPTNTGRADLFDGHDKELPSFVKDGDSSGTETSSGAEKSSDADSSSGAESRVVGLFLGMPLLVAWLQLV